MIFTLDNLAQLEPEIKITSILMKFWAMNDYITSFF